MSSHSFLEVLLLAVLGLGGAIMIFVLTRRDPRIGLIIWLIVIAFVPIWVEARLVVPLSAASAVSAVVAAALLMRGPVRWSLSDLLVAFLLLAAVAPLSIGRVSFASVSAVVTIWMVTFVLGRLMTTVLEPRWIYGAVALVFTIVSALAVVEFLTGWHGLAAWGPSNATKAAWSPIQVRSGLARSEGAFGHSIALGASLAIALVLTIESRFRPVIRLAMISMMLLGVAVTLSRTGVLCAAVGLLLSIVFSRAPGAREVRKGLVVLTVVAAAGLVPFLENVLSASDEAAGSADYRGDLLSLVPFFNLFGRSDSLQITPQGQAYFGLFHSIDSQLILFGLSYGWMTLGLVLLLLALAVVRCVTGRAAAPTIAMVAQLPALTTVALITQYHVFFWCAAGLAVGAEAAQGAPGVERVPLKEFRSLGAVDGRTT